MNKFIITQQEITLIVQDLREAPAKYSFRTLQILNNIKPIDEEKKDSEFKQEKKKQDKKEDKK